MHHVHVSHHFCLSVSLLNLVKFAILNGYRHIDCALVYQNEDEVAKALNQVISSGAVKKEHLFITSECCNTCHDTAKVRPFLEKTLKSLQLHYVNLYLIHWQFAYQAGDDANGDTLLVDTDYLDTRKGAQEVQKAGFTETIGVSNFNSKQIVSL